MTYNHNSDVFTGAFKQLGRRQIMPDWRQAQSSECGLACLAMIGKFFGLGIDLFSLRSRFPVSARGWTLQTLMRNAGVIGLSTRALRIDIEGVRSLRLPAVLHWDFKHFVVLVKVKRNNLIIHDPSVGRRSISWEELNRSFTGVVLEIWPAQDFASGKENSVAKRSVIGRPAGLIPIAAKLISIGICLELISITIPIFSQWGVDNVTTSGDLDLLFTIACSMAILLGFQVLLSAVRSWFVTRATAEFILRWKADVFSHLVSLPVSFFQTRKIGDITSRFDSIERIINILNDNFSESLIDSIFGICTLAIMLYYNLYLSLIALAGAALYVSLRVIRARKIRDLTQLNMIADARQSSSLIEAIRGIKVLKLFAQESEHVNHWFSAAIEEANSDISLSQTKVVFRAASSIIGGAEQVSIFWLSMYLVTTHAMTVGMVVAFFAYRQQFYSSITSFADNMLDLYVVKIHAERVADIVFCDAEVTQSTSGERAGPLSGSIALRNVSFKFGPHEATILNNLSLNIAEGESVAIAGPSGCGKSTLLNLLSGFIMPSDGAVLIGGIDLASLGLNTVRREMAAVMQDDLLFSGTIASNISTFSHEVDMARIIRCAKIAAIHDDILAMPMGYNTLVGDIGSSLSGGERQRIFIARALYRKPKILILDEATSHLDLQRETLVNEGIRALGITRIIVAHRVETLCSADRIILLNNGSVVAETREPPDRASVTAFLQKYSNAS